jgi:hypothetical protein
MRSDLGSPPRSIWRLRDGGDKGQKNRSARQDIMLERDKEWLKKQV